MTQALDNSIFFSLAVMNFVLNYIVVLYIHSCFIFSFVSFVFFFLDSVFRVDGYKIVNHSEIASL